jgi:hypothetical protein
MQLQEAAAPLHRGCRWRSSCVLLLAQSLTQPPLPVQLPVLQTQGKRIWFQACIVLPAFKRSMDAMQCSQQVCHATLLHFSASRQADAAGSSCMHTE